QSGSIVRGFEERCRRRLSTPYDAEHLGRSSHREDSTPQYVKRLLHFYHPPVTGWVHFKVGRMVRPHFTLRSGLPMLAVIQIFYDLEDDVAPLTLGGPETERSLTFPNPRGRFLPERVARTCLIEGIDRSKLRKWLDRPVRRREPKPLPKTVRIKGA